MSAPRSTSTAPDPYQRLGHEELVPALHRLITPIVAAARARGPIPSPRTVAFLSAPREAQLAAILTAGLHLVLFGDPADVARRAAGLEVHSGDTAYWRRLAQNHVPHEVMERRRAVPGQIPRAGVPAA